MEMLRCANLNSLPVPHVANEDMTIDGYAIPKGSWLVSNLYSIQRDPRWWPNPDLLDPTRFLDKNGNFIRRPEPEGFVPFASGMCIDHRLWLTYLR